jgi:hypothetical protein
MQNKKNILQGTTNKGCFYFYFYFHHSKTIGAKKRKTKSNFDDILMIYSLTSDHNKYACTTNHYKGKHLLIMRTIFYEIYSQITSTFFKKTNIDSTDYP